MRIAHIFMVHKNPAQLELLLTTMRHPGFDFYIHVDKKTDIGPFLYLQRMENVTFISNRIICNWGGFSLVTAIINAIDQVLESGKYYDFINLLSAQDFPIKPITDIYDFFERNKGVSFVSFDASNESGWWKKAVARFEKYHFTDNKFRGVFFLQKILNRILPRRTFLDHFEKMYGGSDSSWWTITTDCARYLSNYFKDNPDIVVKLRHTWGIDEVIVATVLMNSTYRDQIVNENYRYIKFTDNTGHPAVLTMKDYDDMIRSDMFFARKFDAMIDADVLLTLQIAVTSNQPELQ